MCFSKSPKMPDAPPPPPPPVIPPPPPTIQPAASPTEISQQSQAERQKKLKNIQYGLSSTIKSGPRGVVGAGPELQPEVAGKKTLG